MRRTDWTDLAALLFLVALVLFVGRSIYDGLEQREEPTITVESVEFNENCRATRMFVIDMKGYPLRVFDCGEQ